MCNSINSTEMKHALSISVLIAALSLCVAATSLIEIDSDCNIDIKCGTNSLSTSFKRHPTDCAKSYRCYNGALRIYTCPDSEHFSNDLQRCITPVSAQCEVECIKEEPPEETTTEESTEKPELLECVFSRCPGPSGPAAAYLLHSDCSKYCVCVDHSIFTLTCAEPLHFNPKLNVCDWPAYAGC